MKFFKFLGCCVVFLVIVGIILAAVGFFMPNQWKTEKTVAMNAAPEAIHPQIANLKNWVNWAPWTAEEDPTLKYTYEGPESGVGASEKWTSEKLGNGALKITASDPATGIEYDISFDDEKNWHQGAIRYKKTEAGTDVTWTFDMETSSIIEKYMMFLFSSMLEEVYDKGLQKLKGVVEQKSSEEEKKG